MSTWPEDVIRAILTQFGDPHQMRLGGAPPMDKEEDRDCLYAISMMASSSRTFMTIAQPMLYHGVCLTDVNRIVQLQELLLVNPHLGSLTRVLTLISPNRQRDDVQDISHCANMTQMIFPYLKNLEHLHLRDFSSYPCCYFETIDFSPISAVHTITTERASFTSINSFMNFLDVFSALTTLTMEISIDSRDQPASLSLTPGQCRQPLQTLKMKTPLRLHGPIFYKWLIATGRARGIQSISLPRSYAEGTEDFGPLVRHAADTLMSITVMIGGMNSDKTVPFPLGSLPRLRKLNFESLFFSYHFEVAAIALPALLSTNDKLEVTMNIDLMADSLDVGEPLWRAIEATPAGVSYILRVYCIRVVHSPSSAKDVEDCLPTTNARGALKVFLDITEDEVIQIQIQPYWQTVRTWEVKWARRLNT